MRERRSNRLIVVQIDGMMKAKGGRERDGKRNGGRKGMSERRERNMTMRRTGRGANVQWNNGSEARDD